MFCYLEQSYYLPFLQFYDNMWASKVLTIQVDWLYHNAADVNRAVDPS
jgi:hypothetical protein